MRGNPETMRVLRPRSAQEALAAFSSAPNAVPLAGGTDFMVAWNMGRHNDKTILDLSGIKSWSRIKALGNRIEIGALATHGAIQSHLVVRREFPLLVQACSRIGALAIQNRGTLGGNIANASPAGDTFPVLAVHEAAIQAVSAQGLRSIPFSEIFAGVKKTTLHAGELIESVRIDFLKPRATRRYFRKVGTRAAQALSKTVAAGLLWLSRDGRVEEMRFAVGSMAPTVKRLARAEEYLRGRTLSEKTISRACALLAEDVSPIDDVRSTAEYRLAVSRNLLREFLAYR